MAYGGLGYGRASYSSADVLQEMQSSGYQAWAAGPQLAPAQQLEYGGMSSEPQPMDFYPSFTQSNKFAAEATTAAGSWTDASQQFSQQMADAYAGYDPSSYGGIPPELLEGAVHFETRAGRVVSERLIETQHRVVAGVPREMFDSGEVLDQEAVRMIIDRVSEGGSAVAGVRPIYMMEKIVEVPHVITREYDRHVPKVELIERLIEVPKTEIQTRTVTLPPQIQYEERIKEVLQIVEEERVIHVPRRIIQERLIEVPRVRFVERIEYEDVIEYREVPVDKIIEVPEIEYRVREVEQLVPQRYIQEYYVDRYVEVPVTQVQEVERMEYVPVVVPQGGAASPMAVQLPTQPLQPAGPPAAAGAAASSAAAPQAQPPAQPPLTASGPPTPPVPPPASQLGMSAPGSLQNLASLPVGSSFLVPRGTFRSQQAAPGAAPAAHSTLAPAWQPGEYDGPLPGTNPFQSYAGMAASGPSWQAPPLSMPGTQTMPVAPLPQSGGYGTLMGSVPDSNPFQSYRAGPPNQYWGTQAMPEAFNPFGSSGFPGGPPPTPPMMASVPSSHAGFNPFQSGYPSYAGVQA